MTPVVVPLSGTGQAAVALTANPSPLTFPEVGLGQTSSALAVTITNSGASAIASLTLAAGAPFSVTQTTCTGSLASGANCTASLVFTPTAGGTATGALTVSAPSLGVLLTVPLSGVGFDFTAAISGASTLTVSAGQTADYVVTITPANGASGTFSYTCGTLPANAVCLFNPAATTVSSGATGFVTVEIATGKATARMESPAGWRLLPLSCWLLLPLALWRRRKALLILLLLALLACGVSSCTSSGGDLTASSTGSGNSTATPAGTYTIPVTVTSSSISHSVSYTLTVD